VLAFLFPGQGSLRPGMGAPWTSTSSWSVVDGLSDVLGRDISALLLTADAETITSTANAQAATLALSLVVLDHVGRQGLHPGAVAGHSLGEYSALVAGGILTAETAMGLVRARGDAMQSAADAAPGTMAAVLGLDPAGVIAACAEVADAWMANDNAPGQVVIAGTVAGVTAAGEVARARGASRVLPLTVGGAFHSPLMVPAQPALDHALADAEYAAPDVPVVTNVDACDHTDGDWRARLSAQLCQAVRWRESLARLAGLGVTEFVELGPGEALTGMVKRTVPTGGRHAVGTPAAADKLMTALAG
jgi:[acyl-carrier-protein] S-malonyltransferase